MLAGMAGNGSPFSNITPEGLRLITVDIKYIKLNPELIILNALLLENGANLLIMQLLHFYDFQE